MGKKQSPHGKPQATKDVTVEEAKATAKGADKGKLKDLIVEEACKLRDGKTHSVQQLLAYARRL